MNASRGKSKVRSNLVWAAVWASLLGAIGSGAREASAQQVEVVGDETAVRLDPNATSPAIATLPAGAVLEWVGESGPYYLVTVPGAPGQDDLIGYVLASELEVVGTSPGGPGSPSPGPNAAMPVPGVGQQHANAKRSRANGLKRAAQGAAVATAAELTISIGFEVEDEDSYADSDSYQSAQDRRSKAETFTNVALIGAAALVAYGIGSYVTGWRKMAGLEREFPEATTPPLDRQYAEAKLGRSLGRRKILIGGLLAGAAYGSTEWVPGLAVPKSEDFKTDVAYQNAVDKREKVERGRNWVVGGGGVLVAWGLAQWFLAGQKMGEIEDMSRMGISAHSGSSGSRPAVNLFVDRADARTRLGVAWRW